MRRWPLTAAGAGLALQMALFAQLAVPARAQPVTQTVRVTSGGIERSAIIHVPDNAGPDPVPVLVAFHGGGGNAEGYRRTSGIDAVASAAGFVVMYPDGTGRIPGRLLTWNAGRCCGYAAREQIDDVAATWALLARAAQKLPLDPARVYLTGHSNGAMMAYRVAAEAAARVAAVIGVGGAMQLDSFAPAVPVPVMHIHSIDDPRALYEGGLGPPFPMTRSRVEHSPVEVELGRWLERNGCTPEAERIERRVWSNPEGDEHRAEHLRYGPCSGAPVEMWRLRGPGHAWPGGRASRLLARIVAPPTEVIDAGAEAWAFAAGFRREAAPPLLEGSGR